MASVELIETATNDGNDEYATADEEQTSSEPPSPKKARKANNTVVRKDPGSTAPSSKLSDAVQEATSKSENQAMNMQCDQPEMMKHCDVGRSHRMPPSLPAILLEPNDPNKVPKALRRLDPETRIDIFNRKTGKIMTGQDAIRIEDLSHALLRHAEYEPIVTAGTMTGQELNKVNSSSPSMPVTREGRSAPNIRVSETVTPQTKLAVCERKGEEVRVSTGPYGGYVGTIDSRTPGGWYVLSHVRSDTSDKLEFPLVVEPEHIESVSKIDKAESPSGKNQSIEDDVIQFFNSCVTSRTSENIELLRNRIEELSNEESSLSRRIEDSRNNELEEKYAASRLSNVRELKTNAQKELDMALEQTRQINKETSIEL